MQTLGEGEPHGGPWRVVTLREFAAAVLSTPPAVGSTPIVAIDGRSSSGKTTLSRRIAAEVPGARVVHTDDIAWWHSFFGWTDLLVSGVLDPVRRGEPVSYRPPAWDERGRTGAIEVPAAARLLLIEGVGAGRRELARLLDAIVYVQGDLRECGRRDTVRIEAGEASADVAAAWQAEELPFLADQRPWERATLIVGSTTDVPHDRSREVVVADGPLTAAP